MREADRIEVLRILEAMSEAEWMTLAQISSAAGRLHPNIIARHLRTTTYLHIETRGKSVVSPRGRKYLVNEYRRKPGSLEKLKGTLCQQQPKPRSLNLRS
jgi:hypothetical protein